MSQDKNINSCNRSTADKSLAKILPKGICVPKTNTADEIIRDVDFNGDEKLDIIIRHSKYPLKNGAIRAYAFFANQGDTAFILKQNLENLVPPFLENVYAATLRVDSLSTSLVETYPYDARLELVKDTIKVSHLIPDYYGKTYEFVFDKEQANWFLKKTRYWIGGLDERDIEQLDLVPKLSQRNTLEVKTSTENIPIQKFDLAKSRKNSDSQEKDYFMEKYNLLEWSNKLKNH